MGQGPSTQTGPQGSLGRVGQYASSANQGALNLAAGLNTAAQTTTALTQGATQLAQAIGPGMNTFRLAMANLQRQQGATYGGAGHGHHRGFFGGDDDVDPAKGLREYEASLSAQTKEDVVRRLARGLKRAGVPVDPEGDLDEIVRQLVANIPNPRKNKQSFAKEAEAQEKICQVVANVLNDEFTPGATKAADKLIDTSLSAVEVCRAVGEWAHSFAAGVNTEFLAVHTSVRALLRDIQILDQVMAQIWAKIQTRIQASNDPEFSREVDPLAEVYSRAQNERRRQEEVLKNILNVQLGPAAKELEIAMRDESEQHALVKRLGLKPGTTEFSESLATAISGLGTAASIAQRVHKALKQVGASVRQYLESREFDDFRRILDAKVESGEIRSDDLAKFLEAVETLRYGFGNRDEPRFREALEEAEKTGGRRQRRRGGAGDEDRTPIAKRVEREQTEKKVIIRDFAGRMSRHYDELLAAVKAMGPRLGKEIPLTDKTDALRDALSRLSDMRSQSARLELALIGRYIDAEARQRKETFTSALRVISGACTSIMELEIYRSSSAYFARLKAAIDSIEKTIDYFADVIAKKFGGDISGGDDWYEGGAGEDIALPEIARSGLSLTEAVNEFAYFYYVARIRANLEQTSKELSSYGEQYTELLGDAVAARLYNLEKDRRDILARLTPGANPGGLGAPVFGAGGLAWLPPAAGGNDAQTKALAAVKKWVEDEFDIKAKFYRALQAVDLNMKAFTAGITSDPDAVRDIKKMLDGTQVIARWFSEKTGEFIWQAFDRMGASNFTAGVGAGVVASAAGTGAINDVGVNADRHYYERVGAAAANTFGVPEFGVQPTGADGDPAAAAKKSIGDALDFFQGLKNLVNAFARIGDKFGGRELRTQVFMSPAQIYKALIDYLKQSALSINAYILGGAVAASPIARTFAATGAIDTTADAVPLYNVYFGAVGQGANGAKGNYEIENRYFVLIIKAMAAKILTTLGVYDMFERTTPLYNLTPTRMIVGGAGGDTDPDTLEGASELYFRMPRLAEFYRHFLRWDGTGGNAIGGDLYKIAILPELEGVFSGLIRLIFQKAAAPETGDYSDSELRMMVSEINRIYEHFQDKSPGQATKAALTAFVVEINRRYGVIKQKDMKEYWSMIALARGRQDEGLVNDTNYAILPDEDASEVDRRAPSDRYVLPSEAGRLPEPFKGRTQLDDTGELARKMLRDFRTQLDTKFQSPEARAAFGSRTYALLIQQAESEIRRTASRDAKLKVAFRLIQGTSVIGTDANKAFMFHETVVMGLDILSAIEALLRRFSNVLDAMNPITIESAIMDAIYAASEGIAFNEANTAVNAVAAVHIAAAITKPQFLALIAARLAKYAPAAVGGNPGAELVAAPVTWFDRYIFLETAPLAGRCGMAGDVAIDNIFDFINREEGDYNAAATGLGPVGSTNRPSMYVHPDPEAYNTDAVNLAKKDGTTLDADAGTAAGANPAGIIATARFVRALRLVARSLTNYGLIMRDFTEFVYDLSTTTQGLIEVRYTQGPRPGIQFGFSKLRGLAETLLADVKFYFEQFRPYLNKDTITRFEDGNQPGSIFWLENRLVDVFFRGTSDNSPKMLEGISRRANHVLQGLIRETRVRFDVLTVGGLGGNAVARAGMMADPGAGNFSHIEWYGQAFSGLIFYSAIGATSAGVAEFTSNTGIAAVPGPLPAAPFSDADYPLSTSILTARPGPPTNGVAPVAAGGATNRFVTIYAGAEGMTVHRSLLFAFNQLLARYLQTLTDVAGGRRIYIQLINALANGTLSQAVTLPGGNTYPDIALQGEPFGMRGDPRAGAILFESIAWILQRFMKDVNPNNQVPDHLVATLTDIPLYMKEAYRANIPSFLKLFDFVAQKCEFIKQFIQKVPVRLDRQSQTALAVAANGAPVAAGTRIVAGAGALRGEAAGEYPANSLKGLEPFAPLMLNDAMRARLVSILDALSGACFTVENVCSEVLKELGDSPAYFQTQEGSIETYKMRYEKTPLMPLSLSLWFLGDISRLGVLTKADYNDLRLFPSKTLGSPDFKMLYGVRQLLARTSPVGFEQMPGVRALLDAYNGVSTKREQLEEGRYLKYAQNVVAALRFLVDTRNFKPLIATSSRLPIGTTLAAGGGLLGRVSFIGAAANNADGLTNYVDHGAGVVGLRITGSTVYTLAGGAEASVDSQTVLMVAESSNQDEESTKISNRVGGQITGVGRGRDMEQIFNLIDMNIIPINVHALMRDIPLAPLYNYEFTFEQMVASMFGEQVEQLLGVGYVPTRTRHMLLLLLIDPLRPVSDAEYAGDHRMLGSASFVQRIFRGDNDLGMGRPKFLSDQLFNKALFGSIYQSRTDYDEAGPSTGIGVARGRDGFGQGPIARALDAANRALGKMRAVEAAVTAAAVLNAVLGVNGIAVRLQVNGAQAASDTWVFQTAGNYENLLSIMNDLEVALQNLAGAVAGPGAALALAVNQYRAEVITKLAATWAVDQRRDAPLAGQGARIAGPNFDNNVGDALWQFAAARLNSAHNRLAAVLANRAANNIQAQAAAERQGNNVPTNPPVNALNQSTGQLTFLSNAGDDTAVVQVPLPAAASKSELVSIGKTRFDTTIVREIFFVTNVLRLVRQKLNRELTQSRNVLVASHAAVASGVTEYGSDPFSPNEVLASAPYGYAQRFSDQDKY
jgi:hypothetical protein